MSVDFPNEPSGFTALTTKPFNDVCSTGWTPGSGGTCNTGFNTSIVTSTPVTGTSLTPPNVYQLAWAHTGNGGNELKYAFPSGQSQMFFGFYHAISTNYYGYFNKHAKIFHLLNTTANNRLWFVMVHPTRPASSGTLHWEQAAPLNYIYDNPTSFAFGQWHKYEVYVQGSNPSGTNNGIIKVWIDGVLIQNTTNATIYDVYHDFRVSPTWDQPDADFPSATDYQWWDHAYISVSSGAPPDVTPPSVPTGVTVS